MSASSVQEQTVQGQAAEVGTAYEYSVGWEGERHEDVRPRADAAISRIPI
jgi:hypothetical protein